MRIATIGAHFPQHLSKNLMQLLEWYENKCRKLASQKPDMIVFPEQLLKIYTHDEKLTYEEFYPIAIERLCRCAKEIGTYIVFTINEPHDKVETYLYCTTVVVNKQGEISGKYRKNHTVQGETKNDKLLPGSEYLVLDTEFGKIGFAICFDIGWLPLWQEMEDRGAKAVIWCSAYDGGNMLDAYAILHKYWVISSVWTTHARFINPLGQTVGETAVYDDTCIMDIDLNAEVFHIDNQNHLIPEIRDKVGPGVSIITRSEENVFLMSSKDEYWTVEKIKEEFNLITYKDYHRDADRVQKTLRAGITDNSEESIKFIKSVVGEK